jgi:glycosyltransferase involved in cell wall biosynthesis
MTCIVVCSEIANPEWRWIEGSFSHEKVRFNFERCEPRYKFERNKWLNLARIRGSYNAIRLARKANAQALVTHGPTLAVWCCIFASLTGLRIPILAHSFNFTGLPNASKRLLFSRALRRIDRFVVFSKVERTLYARAFNLPTDRFDVVLWGVNRPKLDQPADPLQPGAYVSAIGGNGRDYHALLSAARTMPHIKFVLVVRPENLHGLDVPPNVVAHQNLPSGLSMNVLFYSRFMVLPLADFDVPCGHVTVVAAMHLAKACIVTDSAGLHDYVRDGENALTVRGASVSDLAEKIELLWEDAGLRARLGENARRFALRECGEERIAQHFRAWLAGRRILVN